MNTRKQLSGYALLMLMVVLLGMTSIGFSKLLTSSVMQNNIQKKSENFKVLQEAKELLLSYAVDYAISGNLNDIGRLPCPDSIPGLGTEGNQDPNCGAESVNSVGYFPFKSLGRGKIEDSSGECLWYIVSGDYKYRYNPANANRGMLNWDSVGYLNLVDSSGNLKHAANEDNFPIAFIISPGASLGQNRALDAALPTCQANYILANYLEDGPLIDYGTDLPATADTLWQILTASEASHLDDVDYNDQVIAIYKSELWDRISLLGDLSFDNSDTNPGPAPANTDPVTSSIESLTRSLAECIAEYGNNAFNPFRRLPYPAPINLDPTNTDQDEYRLNANYNDDNTIHYGRFPQVIDDSIWNPPNSFVFNSAANSFCENLMPAAVTTYDEQLWKNWKDHFFYVVSADFDSASVTPADNTKCTAVNCFTIDGKANKIAAMVIFAGEKQGLQDRIWWWDDATATATIDNKSNQNNYLEGDNQLVYTGVAQDYTLATSPNDYSYCIEYDNAAFTLSAVKCADL